eukprot:550353_1
MYDFWSLCILFFFIYNVIADTDPSKSDNDDFDDNRIEGYKSHSDIKTKWRFINRISLPIEQAPFASPQLSPSKTFYKIPMTESTSILLSLRNLGESTFNITSITGYIHAAHRFSFYVQNNTARQLNSILYPNSEITLEYGFMPCSDLPLVDYTFSSDIEYKLLIDEEKENKRLVIEYKYNYINVTINIYDSQPMNWIDFQLFFMTISIIIFWGFIAVLFYELWWIPNQEAQGKQPLSTQDWLIFLYTNYIKMNYYVIREKILNKPNPMIQNNSSDNRKNRNTNTSPQKNSWLSGTSAGKKKKNKKKN